jgi:lipoate-protein ligase A
MIILQTLQTDIFRNLAIEEYLMEIENLSSPLLFLWQSNAAVVIGKHQNPWKECMVDELQRNSIPIARRISGGGTVFHDSGNLNYTVITERDKYNPEAVYKMVLDAIAKFALNGEVTEKSNISVNNKKFSGNAFTFKKKRAMHHGTLLINANIANIKKFLQPQFANIETRAVPSRPASVINLSTLNSEITVTTLSQALKESFSTIFDNGNKLKYISDADLNKTIIRKITKKLQSKKWVFGKTPSFTVNGKVIEFPIHTQNLDYSNE